MLNPLATGVRRGVVAVVVRADRLLVIRRSRLVSAPLKYCFPGGKLEHGESDERALVREMREELGCDAVPLRRLWQSTTPWGVQLTWWLSHVDEQAPLVPDASEVESVHWLTPQEMRTLDGLLESNHHFLDALDQRVFTLTHE